LNIAKLEKKFGSNEFVSYIEISKPNLRNNLKQLFAMKNLILIFALALASTVNAQQVVQYNIDIAKFHYQDYTFADIFFVDSDGNMTQRASKRQLLPGSSLSGINSTALKVGSLVIIDLYDRKSTYQDTYSAYVVKDSLGNVGVRVVEPSDKVSLIVGDQNSYDKFVLENY